MGDVEGLEETVGKVAPAAVYGTDDGGDGSGSVERERGIKGV